MAFGIAHAQCYIKDYQTGKKVLERDNNHVKLYSSGKKVAEFDAGYLKDYQTGRKLFEIDGGYVKLYSSGKKIAEIDGNYLKDYQTGKKSWLNLTAQATSAHWPQRITFFDLTHAGNTLRIHRLPLLTAPQNL
jgi:hypothetical protein